MPDQETVGLPEWRFPTLTTTLLDGKGGSPLERARLLAEDLAYDWSPEAGVRRLVETGEFDAAETAVLELGENGTVSISRADHWQEEVARARERAADLLAARWRQLVTRADRVGSDGLDLSDQSPEIGGRWADAEAELALSTDLVLELESAVAAGLRAELADKAGQLPDGVGEHLHDLLAAGEYRLAAGVLAAPDDRVPLPPMRTEHPWLWRSAPLVQVNRWLADPDRGPVGIHRYLPGDDAGKEVVAALAALPSGTRGAIANYVSAVQRLVADVDVPPRLEERNGVLFTRLLLPDDPRLPGLVFTGREPVRFAVGPDAGDAEFRLSLAVGEPDSPEAVLDISAVLTALARDEHGKDQNREARLISLSRVLCTRLKVGAVRSGGLDSDDPARLRARARWLFHLLGRSLAPVDLDALLEVTGSHVPALLGVAERIVAAAGTELREVSAAADFDDVLVATAERELGDAVFTVLAVIARYRLLDEQGVREELVRRLNEVGSPAAVDSLVDLDAAFVRLRELGYLPRWTEGGGDLAVCGCGVVRAVARSAPSVLRDAVARLVTAHQVDSAKVAEDALYRYIVAGIGHTWNSQEELGPEDDRLHVGANREARSTREEWTRWSDAVDLELACERARRNAEVARSGVAVELVGGFRVGVRCVPAGLRLALDNAVFNAVRAVGDRGTVALVLSLSEDRGIAVVEVIDSGPGIPAHVHEAFTRGEVPASTAREGTGTGLAALRYWVELFGGSVELEPNSPRLGGACVRLRLPVASEL